MPEASDIQSILRQNLIDAGCDASLTKRIFALLTEGRSQEGIALLAQHRREILDCCHREQKKIDCLDYLVYNLKKQEHIKVISRRNFK